MLKLEACHVAQFSNFYFDNVRQ